MSMTTSAPADVNSRGTTLRHGLVLLAFIVGCQAAGGAGRERARPSWAPPGWLFGPVWITLYTSMAVAAWLVWRRPASVERTRALRWFAVQLALNAAWSPVFFGLRSLAGGLVVIAALLAAIVATIRAFAPCSRPAAALLVPYLAWVGFASALNAALWWLAR